MPISEIGPATGIRPIEHTADIGFEVEGASLEACFARAAAAVFQSFMPASSPPAAPSITIEVPVHGDGLAELLVGWLEELLFLSETRGLVWSSFEVDRVDRDTLLGRATGWRADERTEYVGPAIKGVTRHGLVIDRRGTNWRAQVFVDV